MCRIVQDVGIHRFYFREPKYFGTINFCQMSQDVGKLRCQIAQVPLYIWIKLNFLTNVFTVWRIYFMSSDNSTREVYFGRVRLWRQPIGNIPNKPGGREENDVPHEERYDAFTLLAPNDEVCRIVGGFLAQRDSWVIVIILHPSSVVVRKLLHFNLLLNHWAN